MASLTQRSGALGKRLAAHLLRRTTFQITKARIDAFALKTADQAVDELLVFPAPVLPAGPRSFANNMDWLTEVPFTNTHGGLSGMEKRNAVNDWWLYELFSDTSMQGRLSIWLRTIWVNGILSNGVIGFNYLRLVRYMAKGNLKVLAHKMTRDMNMSYYLNNRDNIASNPNENYAREFLELFTILKGPQIGPADYTNYTEADITQTARVFTGYTAFTFNISYYNNFDPDTGFLQGTKNYIHHDSGNKTFSAAFGNQVITGAVDEADMDRELDDFLNMIFGQLETARAYCRKLYRFFVSDIIDTEIETDIIQPLAIQLHADNYELENTLKLLFKSIHFYDDDDSSNLDEIVGGKIRSPMMLHLQVMSLLEMGPLIPDPFTDTLEFYNRFWDKSFWHNTYLMGQNWYPDNVDGYAGYYKTPNYSKNWFNSTTVAARYLLVRKLLEGKRINSNYFLSTGTTFQPDLPVLVATNYTTPENADVLVIQILETMLPEMPDGYTTPGDVSKRYNYFREALLGGLSTTNWLFEWQNAQAGDPNAQASVDVALDRLFEIVMSSPEFQTF